MARMSPHSSLSSTAQERNRDVGCEGPEVEMGLSRGSRRGQSQRAVAMVAPPALSLQHPAVGSSRLCCGAAPCSVPSHPQHCAHPRGQREALSAPGS